jgi:2-oxoglutarate ferredoxin oxidoreductase subunit alpha
MERIKMVSRVLTGSHFVSGDWACAEGAISSGCNYFAAYPITPATEIAERIAQRFPPLGGKFIQFEDEIGAIASVIGASFTGMKAMTATSGPGISLMLENVGLAVMTEAPCVIINVMRAGSSTGQPTMGSQGDVMQCKWGMHGDSEVIAMAPKSVQECYDLTIEAFNLSEKYRLPVFLLSDANIGHLYERLEIPEADVIRFESRKKPVAKLGDYMPYKADEDLIPPMATFGEGYRFYSTGLTHDDRGYPDSSVETQDKLIRRLNDKIRRNKEKITRVEKLKTDDCEILVVAYGITARSAAAAVRQARKERIKAGLLRLITLWPFPDHIIRDLASRVQSIVVSEMNYGQIVREVERASRSDVAFLPKLGESPPTPEEILVEIRRKNR